VAPLGEEVEERATDRGGLHEIREISVPFRVSLGGRHCGLRCR
jgi:hypothetical protein